MSASPLPSLPVELYLQIIKQVATPPGAHKKLVACSLVSKLFRDLALPYLFRRVIVYFPPGEEKISQIPLARGHPEEECLALLGEFHSFLKRCPIAAASIQELHIIPISRTSGFVLSTPADLLLRVLKRLSGIRKLTLQHVMLSGSQDNVRSMVSAERGPLPELCQLVLDLERWVQGRNVSYPKEDSLKLLSLFAKVEVICVDFSLLATSEDDEHEARLAKSHHEALQNLKVHALVIYGRAEFYPKYYWHLFNTPSLKALEVEICTLDDLDCILAPLTLHRVPPPQIEILQIRAAGISNFDVNTFKLPSLPKLNSLIFWDLKRHPEDIDAFINTLDVFSAKACITWSSLQRVGIEFSDRALSPSKLPGDREKGVISRLVDVLISLHVGFTTVSIPHVLYDSDWYAFAEEFKRLPNSSVGTRSMRTFLSA